MRVLLTGGTGYTGRRLLRRLRQTPAVAVRALVRGEPELPDGVEARRADLEEPCPADLFDGVDVVYHVAHVRFTANLVAHLPATVGRVVVVSSLRALSGVADESVRHVLKGEAAAARCAAPWTVLRPSMIFGDGDDRNISRLAARVRRGGWIPVVGAGRLHQPVWVEDVLDAILAAPRRDVARGRTYAIAGAEALTWSRLLETVGTVVGRRPRRLPVPARPVATLLALLERAGVAPPVKASQIRRMLEDKSYDIEPARRDLGFAPATFAEALRRLHGAEGS